MDLDPDPWNWSVGEVLEFFQTRAPQYTADLPYARLPSLDTFLPALKDNDIDGATLLEVDTNLLKNDTQRYWQRSGVRCMKVEFKKS